MSVCKRSNNMGILLLYIILSTCGRHTTSKTSFCSASVLPLHIIQTLRIEKSNLNLPEDSIKIKVDLAVFLARFIWIFDTNKLIIGLISRYKLEVSIAVLRRPCSHVNFNRRRLDHIRIVGYNLMHLKSAF